MKINPAGPGNMRMNMKMETFNSIRLYPTQQYNSTIKVQTEKRHDSTETYNFMVVPKDKQGIESFGKILHPMNVFFLADTSSRTTGKKEKERNVARS
jgi:hypothetical protein